MSEKDLLSVTEVAALLGISRQRVLQFVASGRLASERDRWGHHLIRRSDAIAFAPMPQGWQKGKARKKPAKKVRKPAKKPKKSG